MLILLVAVVVVPALYALFVFNSLVAWKNRVKEAWSDIDVQLKRRADLIPNLIEAVKGYMAHEKTVLENVTNARAQMMSAQDPKQAAEADNMLTDALKSLFAVSENYPDLKANQNFIELQRELTDTENKIQAARRFYNNVVSDYNTKVQSFPANIVANMFKFKSQAFFELSAEEKEKVEKPVEVKF